MGFGAASRSQGTQIDVAFIGSCTNGRLSDLREAARVSAAIAWRRTCRRSSCRDRRRCARAAEREGLDRVFTEAGFEWRGAGCSMCLAMNPDKLEGRRDLRLLLEPQLQGTPGQPDRTHAADEPGDGRRRGRGGRGRRRAAMLRDEVAH